MNTEAQAKKGQPKTKADYYRLLKEHLERENPNVLIRVSTTTKEDLRKRCERYGLI